MRGSVSMVSDNLLAFVEKRYADFTVEDLDELSDFLDKEKYLSDGARQKLFQHFESQLTVEDFEPNEIEIAPEYYDENWKLTGKDDGKLGERLTWKYKYILMNKGDTQWVMMYDRKTGRGKKRSD